MLGLALLLLLSQSPAPERTPYLFMLDGTPVGAVDLEWEAAHWQFRYVSTHWMHAESSSATQRRWQAFTLDEQGRIAGTALRPSAYWLLHRPGPGCLSVQDELTGEKGAGCVVGEDGLKTHGTLLGKPFDAVYDDNALLQELTLGHAQFRRLDAPPTPTTPPDILGGTLPVVQSGGGSRGGTEGLLRMGGSIPPPHPELTPWNEEAASALSLRVHQQIDERGGDQPGECSDYAKAFVKEAASVGPGERAAVVYGFYAPKGAPQARAHAWVVVRTPQGWLELDPTLAVAVTPETHLALGLAGGGNRLGTIYLEAFSSKTPLFRRAEAHPAAQAYLSQPKIIQATSHFDMVTAALRSADVPPVADSPSALGLIRSRRHQMRGRYGVRHGGREARAANEAAIHG